MEEDALPRRSDLMRLYEIEYAGHKYTCLNPEQARELIRRVVGLQDGL